MRFKNDITGESQLILERYISNNYDGTPSYILGVDGSGNVIKQTATDFLTDVPTLQEVTSEGQTTTNRVSIGTSTLSPSTTKLLVEGTGGTGDTRFTTTNGNPHTIAFSNTAASVWQPGKFRGSDILFQIQSTSGGVGINVDDPQASLHIVRNSANTELFLTEDNGGDNLVAIDKYGALSFRTVGKDSIEFMNSEDSDLNTNFTDFNQQGGGNDRVNIRYSQVQRSSNGVLNLPEIQANNTGWVKNIYTFGANTYGHQIYGNTSLNKLWIRGNQAGTWSDWKQLATTDLITTPTLQQVTDAGNGTTNAIGIGVSTPSAKLHIVGEDNGDILKIETHNGNDALRVYDVNASSTSIVIVGSEDQYTPSAKLAVESDFGGFPAEFYRRSDFGEVIKFGRSGTYNTDNHYGYFGIENNGQIIIGNNGNEAIRIDSSRNVGIGTDSPDSKLHIVGNSTIAKLEGSSVAALSLTASNTGRSTIFFADTDDADVGALIYDHDINGLKVRVAGQDRHYFGISVGIGTFSTSPSAKLHIVGGARDTDATTLLVENTEGDDLLKITDGKNMFIDCSNLYYHSDSTNDVSGYKQTMSHVDYGNANTGSVTVYTSESNKNVISIDYKLDDGTNFRTGTVTAITDGTTTSITDTTKAEIGDTSDVYFTATLSSGVLVVNQVLNATGYDGKYIIKNF